MAKPIKAYASPSAAKNRAGRTAGAEPKRTNATDSSRTANPKGGGVGGSANTLSAGISPNGGIACANSGCERMNGKPVLYREANTVLTMASDEFHEKLLCDGIVLNLGDACAFSCTYCYVESVMFKLDSSLLDDYNVEQGASLGFQDVVIRRKKAMDVLRSQLVYQDNTRLFPDPEDQRVVFTSSVVELGPNMDLHRETADSCNLILEHTNWQIRLLSKSTQMNRLIQENLIRKEYHRRLILGYSIGTLDDNVASAMEIGTSPPSKRVKALHWLQDNNIRTFGMICPSLPQDDYQEFSRAICEALRVDKCEHVWAEVLNVRGQSKQKTLEALQKAGLPSEAERYQAVFSGGDSAAKIDGYARKTFEAHTKHIGPDKLRFLQYVTADSVDWWKGQRLKGAVLIGEEAKKRLLQAPGQSARCEPLPALTRKDIAYRDEREEIVHQGVTASIAAAKALYEIHSYKGGLLWKRDYHSFDLYCQAKLHYTKAHGYRLVETGGFIKRLETASSHGGYKHKIPLNEGQIRPLLAAVPEPDQVACWEVIQEDNNINELTGPMVSAQARAYVAANKLVQPRKKIVLRSKEFDRAIRGVRGLSASLQKLSDPKPFAPLIREIRKLIEVAERKAIQTSAAAIAANARNGGAGASATQRKVSKVPKTIPPAPRKAGVPKAKPAVKARKGASTRSPRRK